MVPPRGRMIALGLASVLLWACSGPPRYVTGGTASARAPEQPRPSHRTVGGVAAKQAQHWRELSDDLLGTPYRYGGRTEHGFDCSGLVGFAYRSFDGRQLPRTVVALFASGHAVAVTDLQVGDLVFYTIQSKAPSHVGIYLGAGRFLHASRKEGVTVSRLDEAYFARRYAGARRLDD